MKLQTIAILGCGAWGTALAATLARSGHKVLVWGRSIEVVRGINQRHENSTYLPGVLLPDGMIAVDDLESALKEANLVLFTIPAQTTRAVAQLAAPFIRHGVPLIACAKGIERDTGLLQTEILEELFSGNPSGVLSGPSFAADVAKGLPTAVVIAMAEQQQAQDVVESISSAQLRLYASADRRGVQIGGALKNVIAIAVGICRGGALGASAEAALVARGYAEITRVASVLGALPETLTGLSGLGDLFLTCSSTLSRNFSYGIAIGSNQDMSNLRLAEGVATVGIACEIARKNNISVPICETTQMLVERRISVQDAYIRLMARPLKSEV